MDSPTTATISSFVIRFVMDAGLDGFRGEIRHIQTAEQIHFTDWHEAVEFMRRYVPLEAENGSGGK